MSKRIRLRFAPSPTGPLHMGGVRTALFSYLFAKKNDGDFILRIEDTDQNRFVPGAEEYIIEALRWCGIAPNEGVGFGDGPYAPYRQSERKPLYARYAEQLKQSGQAYIAFDTADEIEARRKIAEASGQTFSYDASVRMSMRNSLSLSSEEVAHLIASNTPYVYRLKVTPGEIITFTDLIRGEVSFQSSIVDDKVLLKSDGMPTYHLAHIVDDYLMEISHAVRGEEWLPSAPAHILIYRYLGWEEKMPHYAHLPLLLKPDGHGKLSKRDGDRLGFPVFPLNWRDPASGELSSGYREKGYEPEAFINLLALLGWNPGTEQEIFSLQELTTLFTFEHIQKAGARFDPEKALWFNTQYVHKLPPEALRQHLHEQLIAHGLDASDSRMHDAYLSAASELLRPRIHFRNELLSAGSYLFFRPSQFDTETLNKKWKVGMTSYFQAMAAHISATESDTAEAVKHFITAGTFKAGEVMQPLRILVSGASGGADLMGMIQLFGGKETAERIIAALHQLQLNENGN
jgi:glutamyl-tRNA synthetase